MSKHADKKNELKIDTNPVVPDHKFMSTKIKKANRCLVIDDDPVSLSLLRSIVQEVSHHVDTASDGEKASELILMTNYDCVISDIELPGMNGLDVLSLARKVHPSLPFVIVSKFDSTENLRAAWTRGAFDFVQKPFEREYVQEVIQLALAFGPNFMDSREQHESQFLKRFKKDERPFWDKAGLAEAIAGDEKLLAELVVVAKDALTDTLAKLRQAFISHDRESQARLLHRMKGTLENLRAHGPSSTVQQLEATVKAGQELTIADIDFLTRQIGRLEDLFAGKTKP